MSAQTVVIEVSDDEDEGPVTPPRASPVATTSKHASVEDQLAERRRMHEKRRREPSDVKEAPPLKKTGSLRPAPRIATPASASEGVDFGAYLTGRVLRNAVAGGQTSNAISFVRLLGRRGLQTVISYSYFIGMGEFFDLLPLRTEVSLHVMRDAQLDGNFLRQAGQYLNTAPEAKIRGKMSDDQWAEVSRRAAREYSDQFGDNLHMSWSTACLKGGNAHTKLHLFIYDGGIRVIITSANAMAADFVHGDNHFFVQDFRRRTERHDDPDDEFEIRLLEHLQLLGFSDDLVDDLVGRFDMSTARAALIASRPGVFTNSGDCSDDVGLLRLRRLAREAIESGDKVYVECNAASTGKCEPAWIDGFRRAVMGGRGAAKDLQVVFPTRDDVMSGDIFSRLGPASAVQVGGAQMCDESRRHYYRYIPRTPGLAFHSKFIAVYRNVDPRVDPHATPAYVVLGSHNLSAAAWGEIGYNAKTEVRKLVKAKNVELSVFIRGNDLRGMMDAGTTADELFAYERPAKPWRKADKPFTGYGVGGTGGLNFAGVI